jgi:hypothetical protein
MLVLTVPACGDRAAEPASDSESAGPDENVPEVGLIDSTIPPAIAGEDGWNYSMVANVDLYGDSLPERVVLTARVELMLGRPVWDDGQPWQVYVESHDTVRTRLYAQRLQLGTLDMRLTVPGDTVSRPTILLIEHLPDRLRILEARFTGSAPNVTVRLERRLDPTGGTASPRFTMHTRPPPASIARQDAAPSAPKT